MTTIHYSTDGDPDGSIRTRTADGEFIAMPVEGERILAAVCDTLCGEAMYFAVEPWGGDNYRVTVRADRAPTLAHAIEAAQA